MAYTIGLDFGTLSCRGVLVSCSTGTILASEVFPYPHGVMDSFLCGSGERLPSNWALEHPKDYTDALTAVIPALMRASSVPSSAVTGIGIDFTSCTVLPVDQNAVPLCMKREFVDHRNAYVKLWKHHGAQEYADRINAYLEESGQLKDPRFGGRISSELFLPKIMETLEEDPAVYNAADAFIEAGDWLTRLLTGSKSRSCSMAGYKAWWNERDGYPDVRFYRHFNPELYSLPQKMSGPVIEIGQSSGCLTTEWADRLGLTAGIAVAPAVIDSHAGVPGSGVSRKEQAMLVLGTSSVLIGFSDRPYSEEGIIGNVRSAIIPGYYGLESGLAAVGDLFEWFVSQTRSPESNRGNEIPENSLIHQLLSQKASEKAAGQGGLLALDWWNGNKTPFVDSSLTGSVIGYSLQTKPEDIYRAMIEATAYGTRRILELYESQGLRIDELVCSGGITKKNPFVMQTYSDILGKKLKIAGSSQAAALGSAIYASLSAGVYSDYASSVTHMSRIDSAEYVPDERSRKVYDELYSIYKDYSMIMGDTHRDILMRLNHLKAGLH
ncbi:ribulokinase [Chordicoccus furentiruminis]|uniref:ribulokinase n=1 Tax=Chordicoccus furentiruminis TaxID=2709410 RepID=UPI0023A87B20|nr:ribulokinase [Chordicoccus furentiruminis]